MFENKEIKIKGKSYMVHFPNVGEMLDIEKFKFAFSKGEYVNLAISPLKIHLFSLDLIDAISFFSVLIPELKNDLNVSDWNKIDKELMKELVKVFNTQFLPWYKPLYDELLNYDYGETESDKKDNN